MHNIRLTFYLAAFAAAAVVTAKSYLRVHRDESAKRLEIEKNMHLDIRAIHAAQEAMNARIDAGEIHSLGQLAAEVSNEIAFQKIAIREED